MLIDPGDRSRLDAGDRSAAAAMTVACSSATSAPATRPARAELTERFLPLARSLARRYERGGESLDDLTQVASLALLKAIDRFDPQRPVAFSSFAVPTIVGELKRYFRDYGWSVRVPRGLQELALRVQRESDRFAAGQGHAPTAGQLAQCLGVDVEQILEAREAVGARRAASLDRPREDAEDDERPVRELGVEDPGFAAAEDAATVSRWRRCSGSATGRCCACASSRTSRSLRSACGSGARRCTCRGSCVARSPACKRRPWPSSPPPPESPLPLVGRR